MNICLFTNEEINKPLDARDEPAIHLNRVLHKNEGDTFSAGIIGGQAGTATITKAVEVPNPKTGKNVPTENKIKGSDNNGKNS